MNKSLRGGIAVAFMPPDFPSFNSHKRFLWNNTEENFTFCFEFDNVLTSKV